MDIKYLFKIGGMSGNRTLFVRTTTEGINQYTNTPKKLLTTRFHTHDKNRVITPVKV